MTETVQVHKFGGASVRDADAIRNVAAILSGHAGDGRAWVVVSAMGKTTNALERLLENRRLDQDTEIRAGISAIARTHHACALELFGDHAAPVLERLDEWIGHLEEALRAFDERAFDQHYDNVVSIGEQLSTTLVHAHLEREGFPVRLVDARRLIRTDDTWREAKVDRISSGERIRRAMADEPEARMLITQGFIGSTPEGRPSTLGREGSDFSAAVLARSCGAAGVTLWKDVDAVYSADPKRFAEAVRLPLLSYHEALQMTNYGAKVIHPKTLIPLEQAGIPLRVRSFNDPAATGTRIGSDRPDHYPPIVVRIEGLLLLTLSNPDLSYLTEAHINRLFQLLASHRATSYLTEIALMNLSVAVRVPPLREAALLADLEARFQLRLNRNMALLTVRHWDEETLSRLSTGQVVHLELRNRQTAQRLIRPKSDA